MKPRGYYAISPQQERKGERTLTVKPMSLLGAKRKSYTFQELLGKGAFGTVYLCQTNCGLEVAIKVIDTQAVSDTQREVKGLQNLSKDPGCSRYILCYHDSFILKEMGKRSLYIVMEYLQGETLKVFLKNNKLELLEKRKLVLQLLLGLSVIHNRGYAHRDIKPQNIMVSKGCIKYIDFGFACKRLCQGHPGTLLYNPPEYYNGTLESGLIPAQAHDIWSLGVTVHQIFLDSYPFFVNLCKQDLINQIAKQAPIFGAGFSLLDSLERTLLKSMLEPDWKIRPNIDQVLFDYNLQLVS